MTTEGVALVSLDVDSMYNNMSDEFGSPAFKEYLDSRISLEDGHDVSTNSIMTALNLCLKNNYFVFNEKIYKQIRGVGTGVKLAPPYACLGLGKYERAAFQSDNILKDKVLL